MNIVFAGSPQFAVPTLERLTAAGYQILAVLTQPDRPAGREQRLQPPAVKRAAERLGLVVHQPEKIKSDQGRTLMETLRPEALVVVGYGQILPPWLLELPRYGCVNLHASLLPAYRGAAPIQWAVANGETKTGLTTMLMDPGMDTGPILRTWETAIAPEETAVELAERMSGPGAELMLQTLAGLEAGELTPQPQDNSRATKAPLLKKEHGLIDWNLTAQQIFNRLRGFTPWPGIYSGSRGGKLQIWRAKPVVEIGSPYQSRNRGTLSTTRDRSGAVSGPGNHPLAAGQLLVGKGEIRVVCGAGTVLELLEVQLEGRRRMSAAEFFRGAQPRPGEILQLPSVSG